MGAVYTKLVEGRYQDVVLLLDQHSEPGDAFAGVFNEVNDLIARMGDTYDCLEQYRGCQDLCRIAMSDATEENERQAFDALLGSVDAIHKMFLFSISLQELFPKLLSAISQNSNPQAPDADIKVPQALVKQLCELLSWSLQFDQTRMMRPNLSNDFSYYRRLLPKFSRLPNVTVGDDEAMRMSMFTAQHIPMLNTLIKCTQSSYEENPDVTMVLALLANSCMKSIKKELFHDPNVNSICVNAMTGSIILFDHADTYSVFSRKSPVNIKGCINVIKKYFPNEMSLINNIKYSTKTFADAPDGIQDMLD